MATLSPSRSALPNTNGVRGTSGITTSGCGLLKIKAASLGAGLQDRIALGHRLLTFEAVGIADANGIHQCPDEEQARAHENREVKRRGRGVAHDSDKVRIGWRVEWAHLVAKAGRR